MKILKTTEEIKGNIQEKHVFIIQNCFKLLLMKEKLKER